MVEDKILAQDLVPGDLVLLKKETIVSADGRLVAVTDLPELTSLPSLVESNLFISPDQADLTPSKTELEYDKYGICRDDSLFWFWTFYSICYRYEN